MVQLFTILAFVAMYFRDALRASDGVVAEGDRLGSPLVDVSPMQAVAIVLGSMAACAIAGQVACMVAGRRIDRTGNIISVAAVDYALMAARAAATLIFIAAIFTIDWLGVVRGWVGDLVLIDEVLCISPLMAVFLLSWASGYSIDRRLRDATLVRRLDDGVPIVPGPTRFQSVIAHARQSLAMIAVPIVMVIAWREMLHTLRGSTGLAMETELWVLGGLELLGTIGVFVLSPAVLKALWSTSALGAGETRDMLMAAAIKHRVRIREPLVWHTHGSMMNGAVLGLMPPFRYLLFTDLLLERLQPRQVEAVAAHEFGHIRHRHILWLAISGIGVVLFVDVLGMVVANALDLSPSLWLEALLMGLPITAGAMVFGWMSRRFEWQADAFAVRHLSEAIGEMGAEPPDAPPPDGSRGPRILPGAVQWMESSLRDVARMNSIDPSRFTFRHGSIDDRIRRLRGIVGLSTAMLPIDVTVRWMKVTSLLLFLLAVAGAFVVASGSVGR